MPIPTHADQVWFTFLDTFGYAQQTGVHEMVVEALLVIYLSTLPG
jgi:hypothetical protein